MCSKSCQLGVKSADVTAHRLIERDLLFFQEGHEHRRRKHLRYRSHAKEHVGSDGNAGLHARDAETFGEDYAVAAYDGEGCAGSVGLFQLT